jgi:micrococcal nuclease
MMLQASRTPSRRPWDPRRRRRVCSVSEWSRRRRRLRRWGTLLGVVLLVMLTLADRNGWLLDDGGDWRVFHQQTVRVVHVIDGDTVEVQPLTLPGPPTRVRLWGIDTPEIAKPDAATPDEPYAREATDLTRRLAQDQPVTLTLEPQRVRDRFGRLLAYVTLPDGTALNEQLLREGLATADDRWPHTHQTRYGLLQEQARKQRLGLWGLNPSSGKVLP